jgi:multiple sugar transport system substrate-binding protein
LYDIIKLNSGYQSDMDNNFNNNQSNLTSNNPISGGVGLNPNPDPVAPPVTVIETPALTNNMPPAAPVVSPPPPVVNTMPSFPSSSENITPSFAPVPVDSSSSGAGNTGNVVPNSKSGFGLRKILFIILGILFVLGLIFFVVKFVLPRLSGSGGGSGDITWWGLWEDSAIIEPLIAEYEQAHRGVNITYVAQAKEDYRERLINALAKGEGPDIFRFHNSWVPMFKDQLSAMPSDVMSAQEFAQTFYPVAASDLTVGSSIVGIPLMYDGLALFVNDEIFATYTKTVPKTWNELRDTAIDLTIKDNSGGIKQSGVALGTASNVDHWPEIISLMMLQNGVNMNKPTGELAEGALSFYTSFTTNYEIWDETMPSSTIAFASGRVAMFVAPSWRVFEILDQNPNLKFSIHPAPQLPKESESEPDITYASYWVEGVSDSSNNKQAAWEFLKFLSSSESLEKIYQNASGVRRFGELYPRVDMRDKLLSDPLTGGFISLAPEAKSWYMASRTYDGPTGINSQLVKYFEDGINSVTSRTTSNNITAALNTISAGVTQVLVQYGLIAPPATPAN